jgi:iron complex transport system substrate-binding protein
VPRRVHHDRANPLFLSDYPSRIVCLTEEPTEVLYALGEQDRIVGISRFTVRPGAARMEKPLVSAFTSANLQKILNLRPDLVIGFSDIQADIAAELIRRGVEVWISNHRSVAGILSYVRRLGAMIGQTESADRYAVRLEERLAAINRSAEGLSVRPKVYFEEWNDPLITGIQWVAELIRIAGGDDIFPEKSAESMAKNRIISSTSDVIDRRPDLIMASWCGKKVQIDQIRQRSRWDEIPAIRDGQIHEIDSAIILQPGPAALTDGIETMHRIIAAWANGQAR